MTNFPAPCYPYTNSVISIHFFSFFHHSVGMSDAKNGGEVTEKMIWTFLEFTFIGP